MDRAKKRGRRLSASGPSLSEVTSLPSGPALVEALSTLLQRDIGTADKRVILTQRLTGEALLTSTKDQLYEVGISESLAKSITMAKEYQDTWPDTPASVVHTSIRSLIRIHERLRGRADKQETTVDEELLSELFKVIRDLEQKSPVAFMGDTYSGSQEGARERMLVTDIMIDVPTTEEMQYQIPADQSSVVQLERTPTDKLDERFILHYPKDIDSVLEMVGTWAFPALALKDLEASNPLVRTCNVVLQDPKFKSLPLDRTEWDAFIQSIESQYTNTAYHNVYHACDVVSSYYTLCKNAGIWEILSPIHAFACLFASAIHDVGHPGLNNAFVRRSGWKGLGLQFNDQSVLEMESLRISFQLLSRPVFRKSATETSTSGFRIMKPWTESVWNEFRHTVIKLVLATDMDRHMEIVNAFRLASEQLDVANPKHLELSLSILLKCADIGSTAKTPEHSFNWGCRVVAEFVRQGELEKQEFGSVSIPAMAKGIVAMEKVQASFLGYVSLPLFKVVAASFPGLAFCVENIAIARTIWPTDE